MKMMHLNILVILITAMLFASCQNKEESVSEVEVVKQVEVFNQLDPRESAEFYLKAMFIDNDFDALKLMTHPEQKDGFSKSIGSLAAMLVRMDSAKYEITFVEQKENLALIKFNLSMTSKGQTEERKELMTLEIIDSKWYVQ
ncbi:MAG: hypothetical protein HRU38_19965 [Saccharospirillaceae bacterium]|nr:hypothetical protein [Pseudomonadales bacterium]NRB80909.1 hypothetical protein [Saccharospirillaceae bacterium]